MITANFMKPTILMRMILRKIIFEEEYPGYEYPDEGAENEYDDAIYSPSDRKRKKRHPSKEEPEYETGKRSDPRSRKRSGVPLAAPIKRVGKLFPG